MYHTGRLVLHSHLFLTSLHFPFTQAFKSVCSLGFWVMESCLISPHQPEHEDATVKNIGMNFHDGSGWFMHDQHNLSCGSLGS